ncbi:MAG: hypothetical protein D8M59_14450 [Planctomycetes bacterium]|nr:hypothetical protein [Planctomycetota bacterium]
MIGAILSIGAAMQYAGAVRTKCLLLGGYVLASALIISLVVIPWPLTVAVKNNEGDLLSLERAICDGQEISLPYSAGGLTVYSIEQCGADITSYWLSPPHKSVVCLIHARAAAAREEYTWLTLVSLGEEWQLAYD